MLLFCLSAHDFLSFFLSFFFLRYVACGILVLRPGIEPPPGPWQWESGALTTESPCL